MLSDYVQTSIQLPVCAKIFIQTSSLKYMKAIVIYSTQDLLYRWQAYGTTGWRQMCQHFVLLTVHLITVLIN